MKRNAQHRMSALMQRYSPEEYEEVTKEETPSETEPEVNVDTTIAELQETQPEETAEDTIEGTQEVDPLPEENATDLINDGGDTGETVDLVPEENDDGSEEESDDDDDADDFESGEVLNAEADADVAEADKVEDEINDIDDTREALEAYAELIKTAGLDGISQQAAAFMSVGLKRAVKHAPSLESMYISCEAFETGPRGAVTKANISQESFSEAIKETFRKFIEWLKKRIAAGRHFFKRFTTNLMAVKSELNSLEQELKNYKPENSSEWNTNVSEILFTGKEFTGYDLQHLIDPCKLIAEDIPKHLIQVTNELISKISKIDPEKVSLDDSVNIGIDVFSAIGELVRDDIELPGGRYINSMTGEDVGLSLKKEEGFSVANSQLTLTRSPAELKKAVSDAQKCLNILLKANAMNDKVSDTYEKLITTLNNLADKAEKSEDETTKNVAKGIRGLTAGLSKTLNPNTDDIIAYLGKCIVARLGFVRKAIKSAK